MQGIENARNMAGAKTTCHCL